MKQLVENFGNQLKEAIKIGEGARFTPHSKNINNVLISGLGGSGIGGSIVAELVEHQANTPVSINKKYEIPAYVNEHTLVIISSYSGNTEETIAAMEAAHSKGAKVVCVSSGGQIIEFSKKHNLDHIVVPGGMPPRSCLGYSLTQLFFILANFKIIQHDFKTDLNKAIELIEKENSSIKKEAMEVAQKLANKIPVIYTLSNEGVAIRFRQQINENSKMLCWHHVIPEMNHNELVGWTQKNENLAVVIFRNENDFSRNVKRLEINLEIISKYTNTIIHLMSKGSSDIERAIYHIHLGDWISCYIADIKQIDAVEVNVINHLKGALSKV